jgi:GNAT superfamily N-acetyltransferase
LQVDVEKMTDPLFTIAPVRSATDLQDTVALFEAYSASLGIDLSYQDFAGELAAMPGKYAPPAGDLLLARDTHGAPLGCVGLRPMTEEGCCEMKRLYVAPPGRGKGLGKALVAEVIQSARLIGYRDMWLDSLPTMQQAIAPYYDTPITGAVFLGLSLGVTPPDP